jgi:uncharacterized protein YbjT (DUF2867 family)
MMLVTMASGFLGKAVCAELLARGRAVAVLVRTPGSEPPGTIPVVGDLTDPAAINAAVRFAAQDLRHPGGSSLSVTAPTCGTSCT